MVSGVIGPEETEETVANSLNSKEIREEVTDKEDLIMEMDSNNLESKQLLI
jgi:protein-tyrosine-phosphatase